MEEQPRTGREVLVVEDDRAVADAVARRLRAHGHAVRVVHDGLAAVEAARERLPDCVVLDLMLPGLDGLEVCRRVQALAPVPVLVLTARAEESDRLAGLAAGADDYLAKPFSPRELAARVAALLRRVDRAAALLAAAAPPVVEQGDLRVDAGAREVRVAGEAVHLTRTEFDLLLALVRRPGVVVTRGELMEQVWGWPDATTTRTVDSHVKALRRKVGADRIRTAHGVGYALAETER